MSTFFFITPSTRDEFSGVEGMVKIRALDDNEYASSTNLNGANGSAADVLSRLHGNENNIETKRCCNVAFFFVFDCFICLSVRVGVNACLSPYLGSATPHTVAYQTFQKRRHPATITQTCMPPSVTK